MIKVENLQFQYPHSESKVLKSLNFDIAEGEIFGFLGPSGAGKSTTQKILYKVWNSYEGKVFINGKDLKHWDRSYFENIGVGFELPNHYLKLTGKENLELFASFYKTKAKRNIKSLFEMVELSDAINMPVEAYSKGMKMRLNFIRAIQHDPNILFFDEPTTGLDPVNAYKIRQLILDLKMAGKTIFVTTHSMHTADELCDRVSFIVQGVIKATDSPQNLKQRYGKEAVKVELKNGEIADFPLANLGDNQDFLNFIKKDSILHIHTMEATLEKVFFEVTGKTLAI